MKSSVIKVRDKNIIEQVSSIRVRFPHFNITSDHTSLKVIGELRPTARSEIYTVEIKYRPGESPKVWVLNPTLIKNFKGQDIPHLYAGEKLCLFQPKYKEFKCSDYISDTIIPWTSLWLYHYEVWHVTGNWMGGGEHPPDKIEQKIKL